MANKFGIELTVDDKGSAVVRKFSDKTSQKVKQMSDKSIGHVQRLSTKFTSGLGGAISKVGKGLMNLKTLAMGALAGWGVTKVMGEFSTFESALVDMGKVTGESFDLIKKKIMKLPSSLGSATEMVKGYYQVISAGVKGAANQMETLITTSKLAKTAHAEQGQSCRTNFHHGCIRRVIKYSRRYHADNGKNRQNHGRRLDSNNRRTFLLFLCPWLAS
jgi:hypothetical protein